MRFIRIFLFILIVIGLGLLMTQKFWLAPVTDYILAHDSSYVPPAPGPEPTPTPRPGKVATGVEGIVTLGPTCPVERIPPDPACAPKPYPTTLVLASTIIGKNGGLLVQTDSKGYFSRDLTPGTYTIRAQSTATLPRLAPVTFTVKQGELTSLNLQFDSGIR